MTNNKTPVAFWNRAQKRTRSRHLLNLRSKLNGLFSIWLLCGLLAGAAGTALTAWYFFAPSESSSTIIFQSAVCDVMPLDEPTAADSGSDGSYTVRFVAYGDIDSDDDVPCGMLPDVRIAIIHQKRDKNVLQSWWDSVDGDELGIEKFIPLGARVSTTTEKLSNAPAQFITTVTTGVDGTAMVPISYDREQGDYSLCAILPIEEMIAGCIHDFYLLSPKTHTTVYVYLTHGHAIIEKSNSDRYQRFLDGSKSAQALTKITVTSNMLDDVEPDRPYKSAGVAIVADIHVNTWWAAISEYPGGLDRSFVSADLVAHDWVHMLTTDSDGLAEAALPPGDYLICGFAYALGGPTECLYENLASGHHKFIVNFWAGGNAVGIVKRS